MAHGLKPGLKCMYLLRTCGTVTISLTLSFLNIHAKLHPLWIII